MLIRLWKYSIKNTLRNKFLSISSILVLTLLMFFINILWVLRDVSTKIMETINSKMTISLYLKDEYTDKSIWVTELKKDINSIDKNIKFEYKTKEKLLKDWEKREPDLIKVLERNNPLPNTIVISNVSIPDYEKLNNAIENKLFILLDEKQDKNYFANYTIQYERIKKVISVLGLLEKWLYIVIFIFFVAIAVISYSIISNFVFYYKDEIYITKLVWWANIFIYWPFVLQGILYSIISFVISLALFSVLLKNMEIIFWKYYNFSIPYFIFILELAIFILIWAISGYFSSRKFLRKTIYG